MQVGSINGKDGAEFVKGIIWGSVAAPNPKDPPLLEADAEPAKVHILAAAVSVAILKEECSGLCWAIESLNKAKGMGWGWGGHAGRVR
jgi:hypothetical protein